ncbi:2 iron, 2 sulfur cluster binding protein [Wolffia australiana]
MALVAATGVGARLSYGPSSRSPSSTAPRPSLARRRRVAAVRAETINPAIRKEEAKVVDTVLAGELEKPLTAYCRCWRSGSFPLCDGTHVKHNKETGDNVGPLLVKK